MNGELGFNMTYQEYFLFRKQCDSFYRSILAEYDIPYYNYSWYVKAKNGCAPGMPSLVKDTLLNILSRCDRGGTITIDTVACGDDIREYTRDRAEELYQVQLDSLRRISGSYISKNAWLRSPIRSK